MMLEKNYYQSSMNQFIYRKFNQNVKIDKEKIINDIKEKNNSQKEFFLYEI